MKNLNEFGYLNGPQAQARLAAATRAPAHKTEKRKDVPPANKEPRCIDSFADFLANHAKVKNGPAYTKYTFAGREALRPIVARPR